MQGEFLFSDMGDSPGGFARKSDFFTKPEPPKEPPPAPLSRRKAVDGAKREKAAPDVLTVTQFVRVIKLALKEKIPSKVVLSGEISNCKHHNFRSNSLIDR